MLPCWPLELWSLELLLLNLAVWAGDAHSAEFYLSADEKVILDDDFERQGDWQLSPGLQVESGWLSYTPDVRNTFAIASFVLDRSLSPADGAINLYWRAVFLSIPKRNLMPTFCLAICREPDCLLADR